MTALATDLTTAHIGRSWSGHPLEDDCPCPQAACGLVIVRDVVAHCSQHGPQAGKTLRQSHASAQCPATPSPSR